jgi:hypothetical protein
VGSLLLRIEQLQSLDGLRPRRSRLHQREGGSFERLHLVDRDFRDAGGAGLGLAGQETGQ